MRREQDYAPDCDEARITSSQTIIEPPSLAEGTTEVDKMRHRLKTKAGMSIYAKRKCTVEPVIGIVKSVLGFRQFLLRGLENVNGEWNLVALAGNMK